MTFLDGSRHIDSIIAAQRADTVRPPPRTPIATLSIYQIICGSGLQWRMINADTWALLHRGIRRGSITKRIDGEWLVVSLVGSVHRQWFESLTTAATSLALEALVYGEVACQ